jgi:hypothetical protein
MKNLMLFLFLVSASSFAAAPPQQFSADMVMTAQGHAVTGKYAMSGDKMRMEMGAMGQTTITIARHDKKVSWVLMPAQKTYMEMKMEGKGQGPTPFDADANFQYTPAGKEIVDGHPCRKMKFTVTKGGQSFSGFHWLATDLKDLPVKWSDEAGTSVMEFKNIKMGAPPADLFEIPAGYKKMEMPAGHP